MGTTRDRTKTTMGHSIFCQTHEGRSGLAFMSEMKLRHAGIASWDTHGKKMRVMPGEHRWEPCLHHLLALWPEAIHLASLTLGFLIGKIVITIIATCRVGVVNEKMQAKRTVWIERAKLSSSQMFVCLWKSPGGLFKCTLPVPLSQRFGLAGWQ